MERWDSAVISLYFYRTGEASWKLLALKSIHGSILYSRNNHMADHYTSF